MNSLLTILLISISLAFAAAQAPLYGVASPSAIPDQYIVVLQRNATDEILDYHVRELASSFPDTAKVRRVFSIGSFIAYSADLDKVALARELNHPNVRYVEANQVVWLNADTVISQPGATWGLDRITQAALPLDGRFEYYSSAGEGVDAYVIDTGIYLDHQEYLGRAHFGVNYVTGETQEDCNGHGTHVAGTIGGKTYGVAKNVNLYAVKVLNCNGQGTWEAVISGINWVAAQHRAKGQKARSVANLSLGGGIAQAVDDAVEAGVTAGVNFAIAAGNSNLNACNYSPARAPNAITVGATANTDARSSFSNIGTCVDIFAPGTSITSSWIGSASAISTISGTSMAAPHVAGVVALHLGHLLADSPADPVPTPAQVTAWLTSVGTKGAITSIGTGSPNTLLFSPFNL